jgi:hypothetical protein
MSTEHQKPVPTMEEYDILERWVDFIRATDNYWDPTTFGTKDSYGKIFGKQAAMHTVFCLGNAFADIRMTRERTNPEVAEVRVFVFFNSLQNFQVYVGYGFANEEVVVNMEKASATFQPFQHARFMEHMKELFA